MTKPTPTRCNAAELSRLAGYSPASISNFCRAGILERGPDRLFDSVTALKAIAAHEAGRQQSGRQQDGNSALRQQYLRKRIQLLQMEIDRQSGKVVDADDLKKGLTMAYTRARVVLEKLPKNIGRDLGVEAQKLADVHVDGALAELAKDPL